MSTPFRIWACVSATALAIAVGLPGRVSTQNGVTDAPTGFDLESNGFAEEFCANQDALVDSPNSPMIPAGECNFDTAAEEFAEPNDADEGLGPVFNAADAWLVIGVVMLLVTDWQKRRRGAEAPAPAEEPGPVATA